MFLKLKSTVSLSAHQARLSRTHTEYQYFFHRFLQFRPICPVFCLGDIATSFRNWCAFIWVWSWFLWNHYFSGLQWYYSSVSAYLWKEPYYVCDSWWLLNSMSLWKERKCNSIFKQRGRKSPSLHNSIPSITNNKCSTCVSETCRSWSLIRTLCQ